MPDNARIEQFRKMANDDPTNEMGHYSLARELLNAGMLDQAIASFRQALAIKPDWSKAHELLAETLLKAGNTQAAIEQLTTGVKTADARGDFIPRETMVKMLKDLHAPVPELRNLKAPEPVGDGQVLCKRCTQVKPRMARQPFSNAQGKLIWDNVCADCWREWIGMGTKVINEMRLPLADPQAQKIFDTHMMEFLNLK